MSQKVDLWEKLKQNFRFPKGTHELVQQNAFKIMGQSFRRWRSDLNKNFIQQKLTPFHEYGNITPSQWEELVAEKTSEASLSLSACNSEQAKKNQHYPRLGPGGYAGKQKVFRKMDAEAEATGNTEVSKLKPRLKQWIYARSVDSSGSSLKFAMPETGDVVSKILKLAEDKEKGAFNPSRERDELTVALGNPEHTGRTRGLGKRMSWKHGFVEERHMYKKHGRDRESNLERQVKALVEKMLVEKGLSTMEPQTPMGPPRELVVVGSPPDVPSSQGSNATGTPVDRIRAPTSCKLVVLMGRQNMIIEVATGMAHPPGGTWHNRDIPQDYTRVEVHTVKPEFMTWKIEHPTPEGLVLLGDVMNQFILWHRQDIVLIESSPTPTAVHPRERPVEDGEVYSPAHDHDHHTLETSPPPQNKIPIKIRPSYVGINDVSSVHKWMAHDQFKPKNQVKEFRASAFEEGTTEEGTTSKLHKGFNKYLAVDNLKWSDDCPDKYEKGKNFLPNRVLQCLPRGMRKFHDWYLRAQITELEILQAWIPAGTFGALGGQIAVEFKDIQVCFHLGRMEMNLIRIWCLMQADFVKKRIALKHGYIDPSPIASTNFNYPKEWKLDCKELGAGKTLKKKEDIRNKKILEESLKVAAYIALCFKNLQQHDDIWIPYHFNDHWICIGVWLSHSMTWVFDSVDFPVEIYKDFITIVKTAFRHYVQEHKGRHHPNRKEKFYVKTLCACPKQKPRSLHCGYYTCIMMSTIGGYNRNPNLLEKDKDTRRNPYKDDELLEMVGDLCNFIMDQIVYHKGIYHHLLSDLGSNPLYQHLRETDRLALGR
ncbi:uncharacterized protein [Miscanthus floridulus]|uniref:uncharacterized protein n=1 Tax=Miscanthus floridulus TaxID=154761 RepID=UPI00345A8EC5